VLPAEPPLPALPPELPPAPALGAEPPFPDPLVPTPPPPVAVALPPEPELDPPLPPAAGPLRFVAGGAEQPIANVTQRKPNHCLEESRMSR
jgi:hypothetical protein